MFPAWLAHEYDHSEVGIKEILTEAFGTPLHEKAACVRAVRGFLQDIGLSISLRDLGVTRDLLPVMAGEVSGSMANDPASVEEGIIEKIYDESFGGGC